VRLVGFFIVFCVLISESVFKNSYSSLLEKAALGLAIAEQVYSGARKRVPDGSCDSFVSYLHTPKIP